MYVTKAIMRTECALCLRRTEVFGDPERDSLLTLHQEWWKSKPDRRSLKGEQELRREYNVDVTLSRE